MTEIFQFDKRNPKFKEETYSLKRQLYLLFSVMKYEWISKC